MKNCTHCGTQNDGSAKFCTSCGSVIQDVATTATQTTDAKPKQSSIKSVAKAFMIIGCIASISCLFIPLIWTIPMTISYCNAIKAQRPVSTGFKVCALLFVNLVAGICMLCDND